MLLSNAAWSEVPANEHVQVHEHRKMQNTMTENETDKTKLCYSLKEDQILQDWKTRTQPFGSSSIPMKPFSSSFPPEAITVVHQQNKGKR